MKACVTTPLAKHRCGLIRTITCELSTRVRGFSSPEHSLAVFANSRGEVGEVDARDGTSGGSMARLTTIRLPLTTMMRSRDAT